MSAVPEPPVPLGRILPKPGKLARTIDSITFSVALYALIIGLISYGAFVGAQSMGYD